MSAGASAPGPVRRPAKAHTLKTWPGDFASIAAGRKTSEIRRSDDRDFRVGDVLELLEYDPNADEFTGRRIRVVVTHIDRMAGPLMFLGARAGLEEGIPLAVLSFAAPKKP